MTALARMLHAVVSSSVFLFAFFSFFFSFSRPLPHQYIQIEGSDAVVNPRPPENRSTGGVDFIVPMQSGWTRDYQFFHFNIRKNYSETRAHYRCMKTWSNIVLLFYAVRQETRT